MKITLKSEKRESFGKKVKRLRKEGKIPANIFGKKIKSEAISVDKKEFTEVFEKAGETQIIDLGGPSKDETSKPVLVSNAQVDPVTGEFLHIDFRQVDLTEKIEARVPVEVSGESPAEKQGSGTVVQQLHEIEVEALPADLPEKLVVDATLLTEVDQIVYVKDLKFDKKVEVKTDMESIVVKVEPPQKEEVVEVAPAPAEGETVAPAEGEKPAEEVKEETTKE